MRCERCGKPIIGGTGTHTGGRNLHNWCADKPVRAEGITRGAFLFSLGGLIAGAVVIGVRSRNTQAVKKGPDIPWALDVNHNFDRGLDQRLLPSTEAPSGWRLNGLGVIPRELRLFEKGRLPADYTIRFRCAVDDGAIGWVCRAKDWQNHVGFVLGRSQGKLEVVRYRTVAGKRTDLARIPLPRYSALSLFTISTKTEGDLFSLEFGGGESDASNSQTIVDSWRDRTFSQGTFGFFAEGTNAPVLFGYQLLEKKRS